MITNRKIICTNKNGDSVTFSENGFTPFLLVNADDVYSSMNKVNITENTMMDGGIFQGSTAKFRNIVLTFCDVSSFRTIESESDDIYISGGYIRGKTVEIIDTVKAKQSGAKEYTDHRDLLNKVFKANELGRLHFIEDEEERVIDYYVEYMKSTGANSHRKHTVSLICPDPFFYDPSDQIVYLAQIISDFEFIHEFTDEGEEFAHSMGVYENIYNDSANENIGLSISISGKADIVNPKVTRVDSNEFIQIGTTDNPYTLEAGDMLIITTGTGNKHIYEVSNGTTTEINYRMADGSSFIQLKRGNNYIGYDAADGKNSMTVELSYRMQYSRA